MISISNLLCGSASYGDALRYGEDAPAGSAGDPPALAHRRPVVVWNITRRCNLRCVHCYFSSQDREYAGEFTTAEAMRLIDDLAGYGAPVLLFSGGEPLLRDDLIPLAEHAVGRSVRVVISTNGTLITPDFARRARAAGVSYVGVSLDGVEATHDRFRGRKRAFAESLRGIKLCREAGLKVGVRFTITRHNAADLGPLFDLIERESIPRLCVYHLAYAGRGSRLVADDLSHEQSRAALDLVIERTRRLHQAGSDREILTVDNHADGPYLYLRLQREGPERAAQVYRLLLRNGGNSSGVGIADIDNLGEVHADQFWQHYSFGNVRHRPFAEIWDDTSDPVMAGLKAKKQYVKGRCARCRFLEVCAGNLRVRAEAVYADLWAPDPACYLTDEEIGLDGAAA